MMMNLGPTLGNKKPITGENNEMTNGKHAKIIPLIELLAPFLSPTSGKNGAIIELMQLEANQYMQIQVRIVACFFDPQRFQQLVAS